MFAVLIPAMLVLPKQTGKQPFRWRDATAGAPVWMRWLLVLLVVNALVAMLGFYRVCGAGGPQRGSDGTFSISSHGRVLRPISATEYRRARGYEFRSFSGWWMLAYCLALTLLIAADRRQLTDPAAKSAMPFPPRASKLH